MLIPFRALIFFFALLTGIITSYTVLADSDLFDRLDGTGPSKKKVDVIEWEGNLEIHSYPKGSLKGLSAKLDDRTEGKKVMVVGYRFEGMKTPLVRRAILGVPFNKNLKAFLDPTQKDFDKVALSNETLGKPYVPYKLEASPKQWYPDGDPRNEEDAVPAPMLTGTQNANPKAESIAPVKSSGKRAPASVPAETSTENDGAIKNFSW